MAEPTVQELLNQLAQRDRTTDEVLASMRVDVTEAFRQLQTLQGGAGTAEPLSLIAAWDESPPFVLAEDGNPSVTYVGIAQTLLAGRNVVFERIANSPHLRISTGAGLMNVDYVVDSNGFGTHLTLFGSTGALTEAIATGGDRVIWICTTHTETSSSSTSLSGLAANQRITVLSAGPNRPYIVRGHAGALFTMATLSGSGSGIRFEGVQFTTSAGTGSRAWATASAVQMPDLELINVGFDAASGTTWSNLVDIYGIGATTGRLYLRQVQDLNGKVLSICKLGTSSASTGSFWMENCEFLGLATISERTEGTDVDWGLGSANQSTGITIIGNRLNISSYGWERSYNIPLVVTGNYIRSTASSRYVFETGSDYSAGGAANTNSTDVMISANSIFCETVGGRAVRINAGSGTAANIVIMGNDLMGPGSGTAIQLDIAAESTTDGYAVLNSYRDWTTNVGGTGAGGAFSGVDHGSLTGLLDDDHTQYLRTDGTRNLTGDWEASTTAEGYFIQAAKIIVDDAQFYLDNVAPAGTLQSGKTSIGGSTVTSGGNESFATTFSITAGDYTDIFVYMSLDPVGSRDAQAAIYNDSAGSPGTLLASTSTSSVANASGAHWHQFTFSTPLNIPSTGTYWLAVMGNSGGFTWTYYYDAGAAASGRRANPDTFSGGFESPFAGGTSVTDNYSIYMEGTNAAKPRVNFDTGDYLELDRDTSAFNFVLGTAIATTISGNGDLLTVGYARVGSLTAPTNIGDGDMTVARLSMNDVGAFSTTGYFSRFGGTMTDTANGAVVAFSFSPTVSPTSNSSSDFRTLSLSLAITPATGVTLDTIQVTRYESRYRSDAATNSVTGSYVNGIIIDSSSPAAWGTITTVTGLAVEPIFSIDATKTGTITTGIGVDVNPISAGGASFTITTLIGMRVKNPVASATIATLIGLDLEKLTRATTNIEFRNAGKMVYTPTAQTLAAAGNTVGTTARLQDVDNSTGALLTLTSTPTLAAGIAEGQLITVTNVDSADSIAFQDETGLAGTALRLPGAATLTLGPRDSFTARWRVTAAEWWVIANANL
jgi:hypothetical protein